MEIGGYIFVNVTTSNHVTGASTDADEAPSIAVFEEDNDTPILTVTMTKRTDQTGLYRAKVEFTVANGFSEGKEYSGIATAKIGGVSGKMVVFNIKIDSMNTLDVAARLDYVTPPEAFVPDMTSNPEPTPVGDLNSQFGPPSSYEFKDIFTQWYNQADNTWNTADTGIVSTEIRETVAAGLVDYLQYVEDKAAWDTEYALARAAQWRTRSADALMDYISTHES